jgi:hypothetical protein
MFRTISHFLLVFIIIFGNGMFAKNSNFTAGTRHLGRNSVVAVANRKLQGYPLAQAITATGYQVAEDYHKGNAKNSEKIVHDSIKDHIPYFLVNYGLRKTVQLGSSYGYTPSDIIKKCDIVPESFVKEIIQDTIGHITPVTEEVAYDLATTAVMAYVIPFITDQFK